MPRCSTPDSPTAGTGRMSLLAACAFLAACGTAAPAPSATAALPSLEPSGSPSPTTPPSETPLPSATATSAPSPTLEPTTTSTPSPADLVISPQTLGQLRLLWTLDEPGNPNAQEGCFLADCWSFSRIGSFSLS